MEKKNVINNVTPLSNRFKRNFGIKIERLHSIDRVNFEPYHIEAISFVNEERLVKSGLDVIRGANFTISDNNFVRFQWKGEDVTFEELWENILRVWEDYQECRAFPSLVLGTTGPGCIY